jgi:mannose-6-phosphate isomerase-like protein (cupin superfamily)
MAKAFDRAGVSGERRWAPRRFSLRTFETRSLPENPDAVAPDGARVRLLAALDGGSFAHFALPAGAVSRAARHRTVEEIWFVQSGRGRIWRKSAAMESIVEVAAGDCLTIPLGTAFQYEAVGAAPFAFVAVMMPPWPGAAEAILIDGPWPARLAQA